MGNTAAWNKASRFGGPLQFTVVLQMPVGVDAAIKGGRAEEQGDQYSGKGKDIFILDPMEQKPREKKKKKQQGGWQWTGKGRASRKNLLSGAGTVYRLDRATIRMIRATRATAASGRTIKLSAIENLQGPKYLSYSV